METGILLESGTNELEILEFCVGDNYYGINVAKIREILSYQTPTPIPNSDPRIEGIFLPREDIISI
ncbi:MAG: chemotaxis protein CheW, partial [Lachnospiraceae bacterium]|nr:chemotaxis protein CheW [Lachnospiraceae bacterium]